MDPTLSLYEIKQLEDVLPTKDLLEARAREKARSGYLLELKEHLIRLTREIDKNPAQGWASIEVPEVWLGPITQVLKRRELFYVTQPPPRGTNVATITVRWTVDNALTPIEVPPQKTSIVQAPEQRPGECGLHFSYDDGVGPVSGLCRRLKGHNGACDFVSPGARKT